jgi:hypothetical protein
LHVGWSELQSLTAAASLQQQQGLYARLGNQHSHFATQRILHSIFPGLKLSLGQNLKVETVFNPPPPMLISQSPFFIILFLLLSLLLLLLLHKRVIQNHI